MDEEARHAIAQLHGRISAIGIALAAVATALTEPDKPSAARVIYNLRSRQAEAQRDGWPMVAEELRELISLFPGPQSAND